MIKLKQIICKNEAGVLSALEKDLGKCSFEGYASEVGFIISEIDYLIGNLKKFAKPHKVKTPLFYFGGASYIIPEPYGVALIIGPWNYPFQLVMAPLAGAVSAGNCAVIKPSEFAPNVSQMISRIIKDAFSEEHVTVVEGGIEVAQTLLAQKFDYIFYTGSTAVGKVVMEAASKNLTPVTLELGGKSPCIVDTDANIELAARRIVWGKFLNAGQTCVAPDYILVHKSIKAKLIESMTEIVKEFYGEDPSNCGYYARIVNERHFDRLVSLIEDGNIVHGGKNDRDKLYISPTVIDSVPPQSRIMQDEIFGPLLPVLAYEDLDEVMEFVNNRQKPLALYFFSRNRKKADRIIKGTSSGGVCLNDTISHIVTPYLPFGGVGESGMGCYHGKASFDTFSHKKSVLRNQILFDVKAKYPPYSIPIDMFKKIMKLGLK